MKVYDCFTFYNEFELLELRLKSLWDVVDYFVLVEADKTLNNVPKLFYFNERKAEFAEFLPKIRHLMGRVDLPYQGTGDWQIEFAQRNLIAQGLQDAEPDDLVFISDLDEIWAPDVLQRINNRQVQLFAPYFPPTPPLPDGRRNSVPCQLLVHALDLLEITPLSMDQQRHDYYFDWVLQTTWQGSILTKRKNLTTPQNLRNLRTFYPRILNGGWHFSWMGGIDRIIEKMSSVVDSNEINVNSGHKFSDREYLKKAMLEGIDLFQRPECKYSLYDINQLKLPYLPEFLRKYPHFLLKHDQDS